MHRKTVELLQGEEHGQKEQSRGIRAGAELGTQFSAKGIQTIRSAFLHKI